MSITLDDYVKDRVHDYLTALLAQVRPRVRLRLRPHQQPPLGGGDPGGRDTTDKNIYSYLEKYLLLLFNVENTILEQLVVNKIVKIHSGTCIFV